MKWILGLVTGGNPLILALVAAVLIAIGTAGGVKVTKWWAAGQIAAADGRTAKAQKELEDYQLSAAQVISRQLMDQQEHQAEDARTSAAIAAKHQEDLHARDKELQQAQAATATLRRRFAGVGLSGPAAKATTDGSAVPAAADPASQPYAGACTDRPNDFVDAAEAGDRDLKACKDTADQLIGLQAWVREVCAKAR
jgi:hypothetical protein